jgi:hypothetical protein
MTTPSERFKKALSSNEINLDSLGHAFEEASPDQRLELISKLNKRDQNRLWDAAENCPIDLEHLVPAGVQSGVEVIHSGKNSLPFFTHFEKRFMRPEGKRETLYGYNEGAVRKFIGPGYFVAHHFEDEGTVGVDYYQIPPEGADLAENWPKMKTNEKGITNLVYGKMIDYLRKISDHLCVGRAVKKGKITNNFFVLCRNDPNQGAD